MTRNAAIALSGPPVVAAAIGEELTAEELGGPKPSRRARAATRTSSSTTRQAAIAALKRALSLPARLGRAARRRPRRRARPRATRETLPALVPARPAPRLRHAQGARGDLRRRQPAAVGRALRRRASSARSRGSRARRVGVVASQPMQRGGVIDVPALAKEAAFVDLCDTFNLPLVFLQDVPGLMIGSEAEQARHPRRLRERRRAPRARAGAEGRGRRPQGLRRRPLRARRPADPPRPACSPGRRPSSASWRPRPASAPSTSAGSRRCAPSRGKEAEDALVAELDGRVGARVRAVGGRGALLHRRRHRPAPDARGDRRPGSTSPGAAGRGSGRPDRRRIHARRAARAHLPARPRPRPGDRRLDGDPRRARPRPARRADRRRPLGGRAATSCRRRPSSTRTAARSSSSARSTTARSAAGSRSGARACTTSASPRPTCRPRSPGSPPGG